MSDTLIKELDELISRDSKPWPVSDRESVGQACRAWLIDNHAAIRAALEAVGKLPQTADGVPIVPGMQVWSGKSATLHAVNSVEGSTFMLVCSCHGETLRCVSSDVPTYRDGKIVELPIAHRVYSTRAAALAAASAKEGGGK